MGEYKDFCFEIIGDSVLAVEYFWGSFVQCIVFMPMAKITRIKSKIEVLASMILTRFGHVLVVKSKMSLDRERVATVTGCDNEISKQSLRKYL